MNPATTASRSTCAICGGPPAPGRGTCRPCKDGVGRRRGACTSCAAPGRLLDHDGRCRWCRDRAQRRCPDCGRPSTALTRTHHPHRLEHDDGEQGVWVCQRCGLRRCVDRVLPADGHGPLQPLREVLLRADPLSTRLWLDRAHDLLTDLDQGRIPLEHTALDALPHRKAVEHLRALLIATAVLPPDPGRDLRWLDHDIPALLAGLSPQHQQLAHQWIRWVVLPRLRTMVERGREVTASVTNARRQIEQVTAFLTALHHTGRHLDACTQHDIDAWFAQPAAIRRVIRPFLAWARRHRHLPASLQLPPTHRREPSTPLDAALRWDCARRLVDDDTLDPADRVAGALVVLYAQPLTRIVTLTTADVVLGPDRVQLRLGPDPLDIPEPFADAAARPAPTPPRQHRRPDRHFLAVPRQPRRPPPRHPRPGRTTTSHRDRTPTHAPSRDRPALPRDPTRAARRRARPKHRHRRPRDRPHQRPLGPLPRRPATSRLSPSIHELRIARSCQSCSGGTGPTLRASTASRPNR